MLVQCGAWRRLPLAMLPCTAVSYTHLDVYKRQAIGGVALDAALGPGGWRELTAQELALLQAKRS